MMFFAAVPHISVKADEVFSIAGWPITNANLVGLLGLARRRRTLQLA